MKSKIFGSVVTAVISVLMVGLFNPLSTSATVPGNNAGIDVNTIGGSPSAGAGSPSISQDGRYVAFASQATNLVSPASNGQTQIFVRDRLNNSTTEVSVSSSGTEGNSYSRNPRISADGRFVVFESNASNLVSSDTNASLDVFIHDMSTGTTQLVSADSSGTQGNSTSQTPDVSADGLYVVFQSFATNLVSSPSVSGGNIYEKNVSTGVVQLISQNSSGVDANSNSISPRMSCEGRFIIFVSTANNLVSGDTYNPNKTLARIYLVDMLKNIDPLYIKADPGKDMANSSITCNGNYIGFASEASNIVSGDTNNAQDVFVYDRINNNFERVSVDSSGNEGNGASFIPSVSNDGKYVAFDSSATNLVSGDTNTKTDIFLHNTQSGTTELVSKDSSGTLSNGNSDTPSISSDGRYVTYHSSATNLVSGFSGNIYASQTGASDDY